MIADDIQMRQFDFMGRIASDNAPISEMLQEYVSFKYDVMKMKLESQFETHIRGESLISPLLLKYDASTPILINRI